MLSATWPVARQRPRPDAEIVDGEVSSRSCVLAAGQAHREYRALARLACHGHVAAHHARELARDGKPQASSAELLRGRRFSLGELLEQFCELLRRNSDAGICDRELDYIASVAGLAAA